MYSEYLKKEIKLTEKTATLEGGRQQTIVLHSELEDLINQLRGTVKYDFPTVIPSLTDAVVVCKICDVNGNCVAAIGEATENTRNSGVADAYPTTTAANRAFDRAAIRFLGLGRVYSNLEIAPDGPKRYDSDKLNDAPTNSAPSNEGNASLAESTQPKQAPVNSQPSGTIVSEQNKNAPNTPPAASQEKVDVDGAVIVSIGKYKGKNKSVAEIYEDDPHWLQYILSNINPKSSDLKAQMDAIRRYVNVQEGR